MTKESRKEKQAKGQYGRQSISLGDFEDADWYTKLYIRNIEKRKSLDDRFLLRALHTALVIAYCRPFANNKGSESVTSSIGAKILKDFTTDEKAMHNRLLKLRNEEVAHSDPDAFNIQTTVIGSASDPIALSISRNTSVLFELDDLKTIEGMVHKLRGSLLERSIDFQRNLKPGDTF